MIGITAGPVSFLSLDCSGKISDKEITNRSKFYDFVQNCEMIMTDCGFTIEEELATRGATLKILAFTKIKKHMPAKDILNSRKISNVCIHVENVIGRIKEIKFLNSIIPIKMFYLQDNAMVVTCAFFNVKNIVVS